MRLREDSSSVKIVEEVRVDLAQKHAVTVTSSPSQSLFVEEFRRATLFNSDIFLFISDNSWFRLSGVRKGDPGSDPM